MAQKVAMIGHDRGACVATRIAKDYRDNIDQLEEIWLRYIYRSWCYNPEMMSEEVAVYGKAYKQPGVLRGAFNLPPEAARRGEQSPAHLSERLGRLSVNIVLLRKR